MVGVGRGVGEAALHYCRQSRIPLFAGAGADIQPLQSAAVGKSLEEAAPAYICNFGVGFAAYVLDCPGRFEGMVLICSDRRGVAQSANPNDCGANPASNQ